MAADLTPAPTEADRARIEDGLAQGVVASVYVDSAAKITLDVKLPQGVSGDDIEAIAQAARKAVEELAETVSPLLPKDPVT